MNISNIILTNIGKKIISDKNYYLDNGIMFSRIAIFKRQIQESEIPDIGNLTDKSGDDLVDVSILISSINRLEDNILKITSHISRGIKQIINTLDFGIVIKYNNEDKLLGVILRKGNSPQGTESDYTSSNIYNDSLLNIYLKIDSMSNKLVKLDKDSPYLLKNPIDSMRKIHNNISVDNVYLGSIVENVFSDLQNKLSKYPTEVGLIPNKMQKFTVVKTEDTYNLYIKEPLDTYIDGELVTTVKGVHIVRKEGSVPKNHKDGKPILGIQRGEFGKYSSSPYIDIPPVGKDYYYGAFPYSPHDVYNEYNETCIQLGGHEIYGYDINISDSNPNTRVSYPNDVLNSKYSAFYTNLSTGVVKLGDWKNAFFIKKTRPVMLKYNGEVDYELVPTNHDLKITGGYSDISNDNYEGNAMVEFPKMWFKRWEDSTHQHVRVANYKVDDDYKCYQHMYDGKELDKIYIGMYTPCEVNGRLRSLARKQPLVNKPGAQEKALIEANGPGWQYDDWMNTCMVVDLLFLIGKTTDLQGKFGMGNTNSSKPSKTGITIAHYIISAGSKNINSPNIKIFYMEDYYGNTFKRKYGCISNSAGSTLIKPYPPYSVETNNPSGYIEVSKFNASSSHGYISKTKMTKYGIIPIEMSGSNSTYIPDYAYLGYGNAFLEFGGSYTSNFMAGDFFKLYSNFNNNSTDISPSLAYKKPI